MKTLFTFCLLILTSLSTQARVIPTGACTKAIEARIGQQTPRSLEISLEDVLNVQGSTIEVLYYRFGQDGTWTGQAVVKLNVRARIIHQDHTLYTDCEALQAEVIAESRL